MNQTAGDMGKLAMSYKKYILAGTVLVLIFFATYFISRKANAPEEKIGQTPEQIGKSLEAVTESAKVNVPSVSPLNSAVPDVNPIEKANPFKDVYENPF